MKDMNDNSAIVGVKRKHIQLLFEYCIENKLEFSVKPKFAVNDEFELEFNNLSTKKAIALGMCLRELRIELPGTQAVAAPAKAAVAKKAAVKTATSANPVKEETPSMMLENALNYHEENALFDMDTAN